MAVENNKRQLVELFVNSDLSYAPIKVNIKNNNDLTAIDYAMIENKHEIVKVLLKHPGISINKELKVILDLLSKIEDLYITTDGSIDIADIVSKTDINVREKSSGLTLLIQSVINENKLITELLLKHPDVNVNLADNDGDTSLHISVKKDNVDITRQLLRHRKIDANIRNTSDRSALTEAVKVVMNDKDSQILALMLSHPGIEVKTALHEAIELKSCEIVERLLKVDCININYQDDNGTTPLHMAIERGNVSDTAINDIINKLMQRSDIDYGKCNTDGHTAFHVSVEKNYDNASKSILCNGLIYLNIKYKNGKSLLHVAVANGNTDIVKMMVEYPSVELLAKKSKIDSLDLAAYEKLYKAKPIVDILLENQKIIAKSESNYVSEYVIPRYKQYTANVNITDADNNSPLHVAEKNNVIKQLLRNPEININHLNKDQLSPLQLAISEDQPQKVKLILEKSNVDVKRLDGSDNSLLHIAVLKNSPKIVKCLLDYTGTTFAADIRHKGGSRADLYSEKFGDIKLWEAQYHENYSDNKDLIKCMMADHNRSTIDVNSLNKDSDTALNIAVSRHYYEIIVLLATHHDINLKIKGSSGFSPFQLMIQNYPDVAKLALDKGLVVNKERTTQAETLEYHIIMKHDLIDRALSKTQKDTRCDSQCYDTSHKINNSEGDTCIDIELTELNTAKESDPLIPEETTSATFNNSKEKNDSSTLTNDELTNDDTFPLLDLAKQEKLNLELLTHPLVEDVLSRKWKKFGYHCFMVLTMIYAIYISAVTAFVLTQINRLVISVDDTTTTINSTNSKYGNNSNIAKSNRSCTENSEMKICFEGLETWVITMGYLLIVMSCMKLLWEVLELIYEMHSNIFKGALRYFSSFDNILELAVYTSCLYYVISVIHPPKIITTVQWEFGSGTLLFGWFNLLRSLRLIEFKEMGLHIIMFFRIVHTFITRIFFLLVFFIATFTLLFHILMFQIEEIYGEFSPDSILKVITMWASGVAFEDYQTEKSQIYTVATFVALLLFVILVQVIFMNLATGLAIDDVKQIKRDAAAESNAQKIKYVYIVEKLYLRVYEFTKITPKLRGIMGKWLSKKMVRKQEESRKKLERFDITKVRPYLKFGTHDDSVEAVLERNITNELKRVESEITKALIDTRKESNEMKTAFAQIREVHTEAQETNSQQNEKEMMAEFKKELAQIREVQTEAQDILKNSLMQIQAGTQETLAEFKQELVQIQESQAGTQETTVEALAEFKQELGNLRDEQAHIKEDMKNQLNRMEELLQNLLNQQAS